MVDIIYRVVPRSKRRFDVEMAKPDGHRKMIEGFGSEHEASAWIVQTQRMIRATGPWTPLAPRKPNVAVSALSPPAPSLPQPEQQHDQDARPGTRPHQVRPVRERTIAKP
jgi:hypothetical protein